MTKSGTFQTIEWTDAGLRLLDQRRLPHEEHYLCLRDADSVAEAIKDTQIDGEPATILVAHYLYEPHNRETLIDAEHEAFP